MSARVEYGIRYSDSKHIRPVVDLASAERDARGHNAIDKSSWQMPFDMTVVSRTVTEWAEVES